jgi:putative nucleotidyltransferase with HDIG domain
MHANPTAIKQIIEKVQDLPTLPTVVSQLLSLLQNPRAASTDLEAILSCDPPLMTKVLRIANSAFYGQGNIKTLQHAVFVLGFAAIRSIALSASVFEAFPGVGRPGFDRVEFWRHSLGAAVSARLLALRTGRMDAEEAFIAGLIHDIGKIVLDEYVSEPWQEAISYAAEKKVLIAEAERVVLGISHAQAGRWLATRWKLPPQYVSAIFYHHQPGFACRGEELVAIVHIADILTRRAHLGSGGDALVPVTNASAWKRSGLEEKDLSKVEEKLPEVFDKVISSFGPSFRK